MYLFSVKPLKFIWQLGGSGREGTSWNFSAEGQMGRPAPSIKWLFDGEPVTSPKFTVYRLETVPVQADETVTVGQTISLDELSREDNGKPLTCEITNEALDEPSSHSENMKVECKLRNLDNLSRGMRFPTMWHFDKCRLRRAYATSFSA